jgi:hypothetical protein
LIFPNIDWIYHKMEKIPTIDVIKRRMHFTAIGIHYISLIVLSDITSDNSQRRRSPNVTTLMTFSAYHHMHGQIPTPASK